MTKQEWALSVKGAWRPYHSTHRRQPTHSVEYLARRKSRKTSSSKQSLPFERDRIGLILSAPSASLRNRMRINLH